MRNKVVLGANGQLGLCLQHLVAHEEGYRFLSSSDCNVLLEKDIERLFKDYRPTVVINCAAYTAVDKAEDEAQLAYAVNAEAAERLAIGCHKHNVILIHISTDFVFEGNKVGLLAEEDITSPVGVYGASKLAGEQGIKRQLQAHFIIRTSWLYSEFAANFLKTMLRLGEQRDELSVVADQVGTPTYAMDLARFILLVIDSKSEDYGTYHYSNEGVASWYDFARAIFDLSNTKVHVRPIKTAAYPTRAKRPHYSVMDKSKAVSVFKIDIPYWRDSLAKCLERI